MLKEGRILQSNLETAKASRRDGVEERDIQADMDTVQRCGGEKTENFCFFAQGIAG